MIYRVLTLVIPAVGLAGCAVFIVRYWLRSKGAWRKTDAGRFFMVVYANLAALFAVVILNQVFGDWFMRRWIILILYTSYAVCAWWPSRLLTRAQADAQAAVQAGQD